MSSDILSIDYRDGNLSVVFRKGNRLYIYKGVPPDVWQEFLAADSKGKFFREAIRDKYPFKKVERDENERE